MPSRTNYGPSLVDGRLRYLSVSQLERFEMCPRKWWFRYVGREQEPDSPWLTLGTQVHSQIEHYLRTGEDVLGPLARAGKRFLPRPPLLEHEVEVEIAELSEGEIKSPLQSAGVPFVGYIDVLRYSDVYIDDEGHAHAESDTAEIIDWKTTSNLTYAKTGEQIATWQMVGYGVTAHRLYRDISWVRLSHGYFQTKRAKEASKKTIKLPVVDVEARWACAEPIVERIKSVAGERDVRNVEANLDACSAYGGCPHRDKCPRDVRQILMAQFGALTGKGGIEEMSLIQRMAEQKAKTEVKAELSPQAEIVKTEIKALLHEEQARKSGEPYSWLTETADSILPPDAKVPTPAAPVEAKVESPEPAKRGRKPKAKEPEPQIKITVVEDDGTRTTIEPAPIIAKVEDTQSPGSFTVKSHGTMQSATTSFVALSEPSITLYLDAIEDGLALPRLEVYAEHKARELAQLYGAIDVRCAPEPLSFGKWKGALAGVVRDNPPAPGAYAISSSSEIGMVVFEALASKARVIRGVK